MSSEEEKNDPNPDLKMIYQEIMELKEHTRENWINIKWLKSNVEKVEGRQWYIVTGLIMLMVLEIAVGVFLRGL